jgi:predicted PurR-regulated permease PerM
LNENEILETSAGPFLDKSAKRARRRRWLISAVIAAFVAILVIFFYRLRSVLWPFIFAFFIAYIFNPWIDFLQRKGVPRVAAILLVLTGFSLVIVLFVVLLFPQMSSEIGQAASKFPQYAEVIRSKTAPYLQDFVMRHPELTRQIENYYNMNLKQKLPSLLTPVLNFVGTMFSGFVNFIVTMLNLLLVPVLAFYMLKDFPQMKERIIEMIPPRHEERFRKKLSEVDSALSQYLRGQLTVSLALASIYTIGLLILGVPLAIPIGLFSGLANMVPYLGFILGISLSMLLSFVDNQEWQRLIWIIALYAFAQLNEGTWIGPLVVGRRTGLHPVVIMLALVIGGTLFGFMGMILSVPFMAVASVFIKTAHESYLNSDWFKSRHPAKALTIAE